MWDRFEQDRGDRRTAIGTGLGLSIVKLLSEVNGGTAGYRDGAPGAVFTLELPGGIEATRHARSPDLSWLLHVVGAHDVATEEERSHG